MKPLLHDSVIDEIVERHQAHALMVRHEGANQHTLLILRQPLRSVVNRFIETIARQRVFLFQQPHIFDCLAGPYRCGQQRRVWRNDQVFDQSSF